MNVLVFALSLINIILSVKVFFLVKELYNGQDERNVHFFSYISFSNVYFRFGYISKKGMWRAYILEPANYESENFDKTAGLYYLSAKYLDDAVTASKEWAEATVL